MTAVEIGYSGDHTVHLTQKLQCALCPYERCALETAAWQSPISLQLLIAVQTLRDARIGYIRKMACLVTHAVAVNATAE